MNTPSDQEWRQGRRLLRDLLPAARAEAKKQAGEVGRKSALFEAVEPHVTEANLDALMIYQAPLGGWHADLVLRETPPGVPNVFGTSVSEPLATRADAERAARALLILAVELSLTKKNKKKPPPVFFLNDWTVPLIPELLALAPSFFPDETGGGYGSQLQAAAQIEQRLDELCPNGFNGLEFNDWPLDKKARLLAVVHRAAVSGLFRYPMPRDARPVTEEDRAFAPRYPLLTV